MADKIIKIMQEPKDTPCHDCEKNCIGEEFLECDKLKEYNERIIAKEYDRQKAISTIAIRLEVFLDNLQKNKDKVMPWYTTRDIAEVALNALLESK